MFKKILFALILVSPFSNALVKDHSGKVADLYISRAQNNQIAVLYIEGLSSAGDCAVASSTGLVGARIEDSEQGRAMLSVALSAYMSGKEIKIRVNDANVQSGICFVEELRLNKQF